MEDCFEDCPSNYSYALHRYDNKPTKVCDYLYKGCSCGRMLLRTMRDLDREGERRKWAKERKKLREEIENLRTVIAGCKHNKLQRSCQRSCGVALRESRKHRPRSEPADITAGTLWREPNGALCLTSLGLGPWARGEPTGPSAFSLTCSHLTEPGAAHLMLVVLLEMHIHW